MRKNGKQLLSAILVVLFVSFLSGAALGAEDVTIVGTVNDQNQIVDDGGVVYEVAESDMSGEVLELVGKKVQIKGTVMEEEGLKKITIMSYEVVE